VADAVIARIEISSALESDKLSADVLEHAAAFEPHPSHRIAAGNESLADAMAERLGDRVRLRTPVRAVDHVETTIRVQTDAGEIDARRVVIALPLPVLRRLHSRRRCPRQSSPHSTASHSATQRSSTSRSDAPRPPAP
jgi:monoamine oxidase